MNILLYLDNLEANSKAPSWLPSWVNPIGLLYHFVIGTGLLGISLLFHSSPILLQLGVGFTNEYRDGDLQSNIWNGLTDILFYVLPGLIYALLRRIF